MEAGWRVSVGVTSCFRVRVRVLGKVGSCWRFRV